MRRCPTIFFRILHSGKILYHDEVLPYLHRLTAILFYLVGGTFFLAYMLLYNGIGGTMGYWWMTVADLPLALVAILYGGSSLYLSVKPKNSESVTLKLVIFLPLLLIFVTLIGLNFWPLIAMSK